MDEKPDRVFRGICFPAALWLTDGLSFLEKGIVVEVDSLSSDPRGCYASNRYFARFFGVSQDYISRCINRLVAEGILSSDIMEDAEAIGGRVRFLKVLGWPGMTAERQEELGQFKSLGRACDSAGGGIGQKTGGPPDKRSGHPRTKGRVITKLDNKE